MKMFLEKVHKSSLMLISSALEVNARKPALLGAIENHSGIFNPFQPLRFYAPVCQPFKQ